MDVLRQSANRRTQAPSHAAARAPGSLNAGPTACSAAAARRQTSSLAFRRSRRARHGVAVLWLILAMPVLLLLVGFVLEIGNLWLARVQLENALESAALAAVKEWADAGGGDTQTARWVGIEYAAANRVTGTPVGLLDNYAPANTNQNASCTGDLVFGALTNDAIPWVFNAEIAPGCGLGQVPAFAVRAQASVAVNSLCGSLLGITWPVFHVSGSSTARNDCAAVDSRLIRVRPEHFICPGP